MKKNNGKIVFTVIVVLAFLSFLAGSFFENTGAKAKSSFSLNLNGKDIFNTDNDSDDYSSDDFDFYDDEDFEENDDDSGLLRIFLNKVLGDDRGKKDGRVKSEAYISTIYITGVISEENKTYNQKWLLRQIRKAQKDPKNLGILLVIDSPGGTVYESDEAYLALEEYKKRTYRPVYAYFCSLAASGGYYIASSADLIFANRNTLTGSIGVIAGQSVDATELFSKLGIKMTTITAGRNKNMGNYDQVLTDEQKAIFQSIADEAYEQFTSIVADSRDMTIDEVKEIADGRVYTAQQALANNLIDKVCSLSEAKEIIKKKLDSDKKIDFLDFKYIYEENFFDLFSSAASFIKNPEASLASALSGRKRCLYLYQ